MRSPDLPVIMLTGHGALPSAKDALDKSAFDYLQKPADFSDLTAKLSGARKKKEEQEERIRKAEVRQLLRRGGNI